MLTAMFYMRLTTGDMCSGAIPRYNFEATENPFAVKYLARRQRLTMAEFVRKGMDD